MRVRFNAKGIPLASALRAVGAKEEEEAWSYHRAKAAQARWMKRKRGSASKSVPDADTSSIVPDAG